MNKVLINSLVCWVALSGVAAGQSTQGLISGQVGPPGRKFYVMFCRVDAAGNSVDADQVETDGRGYYAFPFRTPGSYRMRAQSEKPANIAKGECFPASQDLKEFHAEEKHDLTLPVAGQLVVDFELRPVKELFGRDLVQAYEGRVVRYFGLDVQRMESAKIDTGLAGVATGGSSVSYVVDPRSIETLPFTGQDVFAALVLQPGVTADNATGRGLGLSVNGQRVASSNFLLDGVAYNDDLLTGPASQLSPESVQEYRISTNNFTAESGGASGFVANAVTRSGGEAFHGALFGRLGDQRLSGRSFERRYMGEERGTDRERRIGLRLGGPVWGKRVFYSGSYEAFGTRTDGAPETRPVVSAAKLGECVPWMNSQSTNLVAIRGRQTGVPWTKPDYCNEIITKIGHGGAEAQGIRERLQTDMVDQVTAVPVARTNNQLFVGRLDAKLPREWRLMARAVTSLASRPKFVPALNTEFSPDLTQPSHDVALQLTVPALRNRLVQELRVAGLSREFAWNRPVPEGTAGTMSGLVSPDRGVPFVQVKDVALAGSPVAYDFDYRQNSGFVSDQAVAALGSHIVSFGGEGIFRRSRLYLPYLRSGVITFDDVWRFVTPPQGFSAASVDRQTQWERNIFNGNVNASLNGLPAPETQSRSSARQFAAYFQDYWRIGGRLTLQTGVRYEYFGFPRDEGRQKGFIVPEEGATIGEQARLARPSWDASRAPEIGGSRNGEVRIGAAYRVVRSGALTLRAAYGTYTDRLFENLVQTLRNNIGVVAMLAMASSRDPRSIPSIDSQLAYGRVRNIWALPFLWLDRNLRTPFIQNWVGGLDWRAGGGLAVSVHTMGSQGRRLITSDLLNRGLEADWGPTLPTTQVLGPLAYRSNSGDSTFAALATRIVYQAGGLFLQGSYTYSKAVDVQSDGLRGDFFDLTRSRWGDLNVLDQLGDLDGSNRYFSQLPPNPFRAQFTSELNPALDRGRSDFDQRHNVVMNAIYEMPGIAKSRGWPSALASGWRISQVAGIRSGFPFTPVDVNGIRLSASGEGPLHASGEHWGSTVALLNPNGFRITNLGLSQQRQTAEALPNIARNELVGPGMWNLDVAVARTISMGETRRLELRGDVFNFFNHANLGRPNTLWSETPGPGVADPKFGMSTAGRTGFGSNFPGILPLGESARRVQLVVRLTF